MPHQPVVVTRTDLPLAPVAATYQRALAARWLVALGDEVARGERSAGTVETYRRRIAVWLQFIEGDARTDRPTPATVSAFKATLVARHRPAGVNIALSVVRSFFRWAESTDAYPDVARAVCMARLDHPGPMACLAPAQVAALLALVDGDSTGALRDRAIIATLFGTGLRCVSLARARVADLDLRGAVLRHQQKGARTAGSTAYLPAGAAAALARYLAARHAEVPVEPDAPLLIALDRRAWGNPLSTRSISRVVARLLERAGHRRRDHERRLVEPGTWAAHSLRRSAITAAVDAAGIEAGQALAGHASIDVTRRHYARAKLDVQLRAVAAVLDLE